MFSDNNKDKKILDAIIKSDSMKVIGRGTLTMGPLEITNSPKYKELLDHVSKALNKKSKS